MDNFDWKDPDIAAKRAEWIASIEKEIGYRWLQDVSEEQMNMFLQWAAETQVYLYPGNERDLGDAFRGFATGLRVKELKL